MEIRIEKETQARGLRPVEQAAAETKYGRRELELLRERQAKADG